MSNRELVSMLFRFTPFDSMDECYLQQVAEHSELIEQRKGSLIFKRGRELDFNYYLVAGEVDLINAAFECEQVVAKSTRAKLSLSAESPTLVSAVATSTVQLLRVDNRFQDLAVAWSQVPAAEAKSAAKADELDALDLVSARVEVQENPQDWMSGLLSSPIMRRVPPANIQQLISAFEPVTYSAGEVVIKEGARGDYFYVVDEGAVRITSLTGQIDVKLESGEYFGEEALVADVPRNASVAMVTDGKLMRLEKHGFKELVHQPTQQTLAPDEMIRRPDKYQMLDVRMPMECRFDPVPDSLNLPLVSLRERMVDLDQERSYVVSEKAGMRSQLAAYLLCQAGYDAYLLERRNI